MACDILKFDRSNGQFICWTVVKPLEPMIGLSNRLVPYESINYCLTKNMLGYLHSVNLKAHPQYPIN